MGYWLGIALVFGVGGLPGGQPEQPAIIKVVTRLFDGMRTRDTALMRAQLAPGARLISVEAKNGVPTVEALDPSLWIAGVGRGQGAAWDERIFNPVVQVDGSIAQVWTYYEFWRGEKLSHCGYDAFFLVKLADGWKISQVADTRKTECRVPSP